MNALLITLSIYAIPVYLTGILWFLQLGFSSLIYIMLIYHFAKIRERTVLIGIELINLTCITTTFYNFYISKSQSFVSVNITDIILACFLAELVIILGGLAIGVRKRHTTIRRPDSVSDTRDRRFFLLSENTL
jgi:putative Mn2+ efflux pump MntP